MPPSQAPTGWEDRFLEWGKRDEQTECGGRGKNPGGEGEGQSRAQGKDPGWQGKQEDTRGEDNQPGVTWRGEKGSQRWVEKCPEPGELWLH